MLNKKQERMTTIAAYTAVSDIENLEKELNGALDEGMTINALKEVFLQLCMYCGFPRGIRGVDIFMKVLEDRKGRGINDPNGNEASPVNDKRSKYERGEEVHVKISGYEKEQLRFGAMAFIPKIDVQLKEYIFADVYDSDVLSYADREIATVAAQMAMNGSIEPQIQFHINTAFQVGLSSRKINHLITIIEERFGAAKGEMGRLLLNKVVSARNEVQTF